MTTNRSLIDLEAVVAGKTQCTLVMISDDCDCDKRSLLNIVLTLDLSRIISSPKHMRIKCQLLFLQYQLTSSWRVPGTNGTNKLSWQKLDAD